MIKQLRLYPERYTRCISGEVNVGKLAKDCINYFQIGEDLSAAHLIPVDFVFDLAAEIAIDHERGHPWESW